MDPSRARATWQNLFGPVRLALLLALFVLIGVVLWSAWPDAEVNTAMKGKEVAQRLGCFACHGAGGVGGLADPASPAGFVPGWEPRTAANYIQSEAEIREWILDGRPARRAALPEGAESHGLVPMPAYRELISDSELDNLIAYFLAVSGWAPDIPDRAYEGRQTASRLGCFGCHGPGGLGGVSNPGSLTGRIPPWDGDAFAELVANDDELRAWILDGRIDRLWGNPLARRFLEAQTIKMPSYRGYVSKRELADLVAYTHWIRGE